MIASTRSNTQHQHARRSLRREQQHRHRRCERERSGINLTYPGSGQTSTFSYDARGRNVKIVEAGSTSGTKQFVWCGSKRSEERDAGGALTRQFFSNGETISGSAYFWTKDHLGSVREMSHMSGSTMVLDSQICYDPHGMPTQVAGSGAVPDFNYASMHFHPRSRLNLTVFRQYSPSLGRWLSRDPLHFMNEIFPGTLFRVGVSNELIEKSYPRNFSLYGYVDNDPIDFVDPLGLNKEKRCRRRDRGYPSPFVNISPYPGNPDHGEPPFPSDYAGWRSSDDDETLSEYVRRQQEAVDRAIEDTMRRLDQFKTSAASG